MSEAKFVHLHCHTHYSLLDGANHIKPLIERTKELGMDALAMTDHGNMFGTVEFYTSAKAAGVKPILGCEVYVAPGHRGERSGKPGETATHLVLLAMNDTGYHNLIQLVSRGFFEGFYYNPRIDREILAEHNEGLIAICGHLGTDLANYLLNGDVEAAEKSAGWFKDVFGPERYYVELQRHGQAEQDRINPLLIDLADRLGLPLVATNDVHYLKQEDAFAQEISVCISTGKTLQDENTLKHATDQLYLKSPEEMLERFRDRPDAIENSVKIAEMCNVELDLSTRHAPVFEPPEGKTDDEFLRELVYDRAARKYGEITPEIRERIDYELDVISSKGFSSYFLIVWDFVEWARARGIPCGARGSGCSAVIGYCLGLSAPDPLRYGLFFERFMDPDRDEMPDIDIDICQFGRGEIIDYVREKYGHVAQIITFGTLKARAAIRDVCRVMGLDLATADKVAKLVPEQLKMTIAKALEQEPELRALSEKDEKIRQVLDIAQKLEGMARHASVHAAGVVVSDQPLTNFLPLYKPADGEHPITQFEGGGVERIGLLKMDFLGLRTLTILKRTKELVEKRTGEPLDIENLDLTDQRVYQVFARGETSGIFQFESGGMRDVLMKMRPNRIEDLIAANALYRPGPMVNIDAYVGRKHGEQWGTPHAVMTEVLSETFGIMVYQEQVSRLVNRLGGIELKRAFRLAKAISKKKTTMIEAEREPFVQGSVENGLERATAEKIFDDILRFGGYAFNKSHSTGYALVAFQTAYMKVYWPVEFMAAVLTYEIPAAKPEDRGLYIDECRRMGIAIRPPDVNQSLADFTPIYEDASAKTAGNGSGNGAYIRFGLSGIKGVGDGAVRAIIEAREEGGSFEDLFDFCERIDSQRVNRTAIEALIKAGAFDGTGAMRKALIEALDAAMQAGAAAQRDRRDGQLNMFEAFGTPDEPEVDRTITDAEWSESEMLAHEKEALGFYVTSHPLTQHEQTLGRYASVDIADLTGPEFPDGTDVVLGGMITRMRTVITKGGRRPGAKMGIVVVEDLTGSIEAVLFPDDLERFRPLIAPDKVVFFRGQVDRRREQPSLRVSEVLPLEEAPLKLAEWVMVRLRATGLADETLGKVQDLCKKHEGGVPLFVQITTAEGVQVSVRSRSPAGVLPETAFERDIQELLGSDHLTISGPPRRVPKRRARPVEVAIEDETALMEVTDLAEETDADVEVVA